MMIMHLRWFAIFIISLSNVTYGSPQPNAIRAPGFSVNEVLSVLRREGLYELCAAYIRKPVYATTTTKPVQSTVTRKETVTPIITTVKTILKGTERSTVFTTVTKTVSSAFATDTRLGLYHELLSCYSQFSPSTADFQSFSRTTTTLPATTIYTTTSRAKARRALSTFPPPLSSYTSTLSSACSSLLASHTSTAISTVLVTTTVTYTAATAIQTRLITRPLTSITRISTITSTVTSPYLATTTITTRITSTTTTTSTRYLSTIRAPAQCAPTAYAGNVDQYTDEFINFTTAPTQPDALGCCRVCVETPNCQAWIFYGNPFFSPPGLCSLVVGTEENICPPVDFNNGFVPICFGQNSNMFDIGLGACASEIALTNNGCILGRNQ